MPASVLVWGSLAPSAPAADPHVRHRIPARSPARMPNTLLADVAARRIALGPSPARTVAPRVRSHRSDTASGSAGHRSGR